MTREGVENGAKVPITAVPHWEGHGWVRSDPPPKPTPPARTYLAPEPATTDQAAEAAAEVLAAQNADAPPAEPAAPKTKKQPSTRLKED